MQVRSRRLVPDLPAACLSRLAGRNDGENWGRDFCREWQRVVRIATRLFSPRRHSSESSPAWMQVVERRREQAAEESRRGGRGDEWLAGFTGWRVGDHPPGCHSRCAGMACFNHWIPACAGMTVWLRDRMLKTTKMSLLSWSSCQRKLESRKGGRGDEWLAGFTGWRVGDHPPGCHSRCAGMACFNHWIPACAGMTVWLRDRMLKTTKMSLLSWSSCQRKLACML